MAYNHAAIPVVDMEATKAFYILLGFEYFREWKKPEENLEAQVLDKDGFILELVYSPSNKLLEPPAIVEPRHTGISVTDLNKILNDLEARGIKILKPITKGVSIKEFAFVADPSGNVVELVVEK